MAVFLIGVGCTAFAGQIITVDDNGPADFNNIQAAIDDSNDNDIIEYLMGVLEDADREALNSLVQRRLKTETDTDRMAVLEDLNSRFEAY